MFYITPYLDFRRIGYTVFEEVSEARIKEFASLAYQCHSLRVCQGFYLPFKRRFPESLDHLHAQYEEGTSDPDIWTSMIEVIEDLIALSCVIDGFPPPAPTDAVYLNFPQAVLPAEALPPHHFKYTDHSKYKPDSYLVGCCIFYGALCTSC